MPTILNRADRVVLYDISWSQFENVSQNLGDRRSARIAYDRGTLETITPLSEHEQWKDVLSDAVKDIAEELDLDYDSLGSTTWRREIALAGVEADNCFYIQHEPDIRGRLDLDLNRDPPPDLALEIDITRKSLNRFPIYARLGVPELWCYDNGELYIYHLGNGDYNEATTSLAFPTLAVKEIPQLIERHRRQGRRAIRRAIRAWVQSQS